MQRSEDISKTLLFSVPNTASFPEVERPTLPLRRRLGVSGPKKKTQPAAVAAANEVCGCVGADSNQHCSNVKLN